MQDAPLLLITAGGTGGHMFPAQALAEWMLAEGWRVRLSTDARGARFIQGFPADVGVEVVSSASFSRGGLVARLGVPVQILRGILSSLSRMRAERPSVVVGFGGYPSIPALAAAHILGLPRGLHEQNGVLGRVNRFYAKRVDFVACGTWPTMLPAGVTGHHTGNPVRAAVLAEAGRPYRAPGEGPIELVVFGGSQGARVLSTVAPGAAALLPADVRARLSVTHQARDEDRALVERTYAEAGIHAEIAPFFTDLPRRLAAAQLVVCRSGASTIADLTVIGRPAILIPFAAAAADHQTVNAQVLAKAGAAVVMPEARLDKQALAAQMAAILTQPGDAARMARAALGQGMPDATERLAALVLGIAAPSL